MSWASAVWSLGVGTLTLGGIWLGMHYGRRSR